LTNFLLDDLRANIPSRIVIAEMQNLPVCANARSGKFGGSGEVFGELRNVGRFFEAIELRIFSKTFLFGEIFAFYGRFCTSVSLFQVVLI
jgi:hypothetical protein